MIAEEALSYSPKIRLPTWGKGEYITYDSINKQWNNINGQVFLDPHSLYKFTWEPYFNSEAIMKKEDFFNKWDNIITNITKLMKDKNNDYSSDVDPLANLKLCEVAGIPSWKGVVGVRMADKYSRLQSYCRTENYAVKDEGFRDTLIDMAVYSLLALMLFEEDSSNEQS